MNYNKTRGEKRWLVNIWGGAQRETLMLSFNIKGLFQIQEKIPNQNIPFSFFRFSCFHCGRLAKLSLVIPNKSLKSESERCFWKQMTNNAVCLFFLELVKHTHALQGKYLLLQDSKANHGYNNKAHKSETNCFHDLIKCGTWRLERKFIVKFCFMAS